MIHDVGSWFQICVWASTFCAGLLAAGAKEIETFLIEVNQNGLTRLVIDRQKDMSTKISYWMRY